LSPLLFVLALQILTRQIKQDHNIGGIIINNEEIKVTAFAGDMTRFLKDISTLTNSYVSRSIFKIFWFKDKIIMIKQGYSQLDGNALNRQNLHIQFGQLSKY